MNDQLLDTKTAAQRLGFTRQRLTQLITHGRIPTQQVGREHWITESAIAEFRRTTELSMSLPVWHDGQRLFNQETAALHFGVSRQFLGQQIAKGRVSAYRIGNRNWIPESEIENFERKPIEATFICANCQKLVTGRPSDVARRQFCTDRCYKDARRSTLDLRIERFWSKVDKNGPIPEYRPELGPCWRWRFGRSKAGYGTYRLRGLTEYAHRISYELLIGPIPAGLTLDHLCRVRHCVNPAHLEAVSIQVNVSRRIDINKSHCVHGHPYTPENAYVSPRGMRQCRACIRRRSAEYKARKQAAA